MILSRRIRRQGVYVIVAVVIFNVILYVINSTEESEVPANQLKAKINALSLEYLRRVLRESPVDQSSVFRREERPKKKDVHPYMAVVLMNLLKKMDTLESTFNNKTGALAPADELQQDAYA